MQFVVCSSHRFTLLLSSSLCKEHTFSGHCGHLKLHSPPTQWQQLNIHEAWRLVSETKKGRIWARNFDPVVCTQSTVALMFLLTLGWEAFKSEFIVTAILWINFNSNSTNSTNSNLLTTEVMVQYHEQRFSTALYHIPEVGPNHCRASHM